MEELFGVLYYNGKLTTIDGEALREDMLKIQAEVEEALLS